MKREIPCPAGRWTRIVVSRFIAMPKSYNVEFFPSNGQAVCGRYRETYTNWLFPGSVLTGSISSSMEFRRKWINTFYYIDVRPEADVTAVLR